MEQWVRDPDWVVRKVAEQAVLVPLRLALPIDADMILMDGPVAELLWDRLSAPHDSASLVEEVLGAFEIDRDVAEADVKAFLEQLRSVGALVPA